ncbi:hypothetical protein K505DRAFT_110029 [Melanomma pulvis-pyrius CBS 109.77]|uniref:Uncharacterized protein n=1 Tax=Melanomma pulvis-pyrius CBS 109.77 TaxID=1314802 RepID=A0A6A6WWX8_9PLEO|nr:hypothetical protein K505DRAFT_110029 [Melanomma pulvis-pyrius CBS 109.77]
MTTGRLGCVQNQGQGGRVDASGPQPLGAPATAPKGDASKGRPLPSAHGTELLGVPAGADILPGVPRSGASGTGSREKASNAVLKRAPAKNLPVLAVPGRDASGTVPPGTASATQVLKAPASPGVLPKAPRNATDVGSRRPASSPTSHGVSSPSASGPSTTTKVAGTLAPAGASASHHQRAHSDPGQVSYCLRCKTVHCVSYGGPFPTVMPSSVETLPTGGMAVQRVDRTEETERWAVWILRYIMTPLNILAWTLLYMLLVQLMGGYPSS